MAYQKRYTNPFYETMARQQAENAIAQTPIATPQPEGFNIGNFFGNLGNFGKSTGDFLGTLGTGIVKMIPQAAAGLGRTVLDMPANIESGLYSAFEAKNRTLANPFLDPYRKTVQGILGGENSMLGKTLTTQNLMNEADRMAMLRDKTTATNNPLDPNSLAYQRMFSKWGTDYVNQLQDLSKGDRAKEFEKSNIGFLKPVVDLLSLDEKRGQNEGYGQDIFNAVTTGIPIGNLFKGGKVAVTGAKGAVAGGSKVSSPLLKGLLELDNVAKPTLQQGLQYTAGRMGSGAIQGGATPILANLDRGQNINWNDAGQQALMGGAFAGALSSPSLLKLKNQQMKSDLYGGKTAASYNYAEGKFSNLTDKQPRFEINDSKAEFKNPYKNLEDLKLKADSGDPLAIEKFNNRVDMLKDSYGDRIYRLDELLDHKDLYSNYPDLRNTSVRFDKTSGPYDAFYSPSQNEMVLGLGYRTDSNKAKSVLLHEIQHNIQQKEGFAKGGDELSGAVTLAHKIKAELDKLNKDIIENGKKRNLKLSDDEWDKNVAYHKEVVDKRNSLDDELDNLNKYELPKYKAYQRLAGEVESRDVQARMDLNPQQRLGLSPLQSQNIPVKDQIVRMGEGNQMSLKDIPETDRPLYDEARKYATKEEFVKALGEPNIEHIKKYTDRLGTNIDDIQLVTDNAIKSIEKLPIYETKLYKGVYTPLYDLQIGQKLPINKLESLSSKLNSAKEFSGNNKQILEVKTSEARDISEYSYFKNESENIILGGEYKITGFKSRGGYEIIEVEHIPTNSQIKTKSQLEDIYNKAHNQDNVMMSISEPTKTSNLKSITQTYGENFYKNKDFYKNETPESIAKHTPKEAFNTVTKVAESKGREFNPELFDKLQQARDIKNEPTVENLTKKGQEYSKRVTGFYKEIDTINSQLNRLTSDTARASLSKRTKGWFAKNGASKYDGEIYTKAKQSFEDRQTLNNKIKANEQLIRRDIINSDPELKDKFDTFKQLSSDPEFIKSYEDVYGMDTANDYRMQLVKEVNDAVDLRMPDLMPIKPEEKAIIKEQIKKTSQRKLIEAGETLDEANKYVGSVNLNNLDIDPKAKTILYDTTENIIKKDIEKTKGKTLKHEDVVNAAKVAKAWDKVIDRDKTLEIAAQKLKLRQEVSRMASEDKITTEFIDALKALNSVSSDAGRQLNAFGIKATGEDVSIKEAILRELLKMESDTDKVMKALGIKKGTKVDEVTLLKTFETKVLESAKGIDFNNKKDVAKLYREFVKPSLWDIINTMRYANILSSPVTHITNVVSNSISGGTRGITKLASGGIDMIGSKLTGKERLQYAGEVAPYYKGLLNSTGEATQNFMKALKGEGKIDGVEELEFLPTGYKWMKPFEFVTNLLQAEDQFFRTLYKGAEKEALAFRYKKQGKEISDIVLDKLAEDKAKYSIFQSATDSTNKTGQGNLLSEIDKFTNGIKQLRNSQPAISWFIPFVNTPANIAKQMIEYSPAGFLTLKGASNKPEQLAKAMIGSTVMLGTANLLMNTDSTWSAPTSEKEKEAFYASGRQPYSIKIGDTWVSYSKLGPLAMPIAIAAALKNQSENPSNVGKSGADQIFGSLGEVASFFGDQSYVKSIGDLSNALRGDSQAASNFVANLPTQMIPMSSLLSWTSRIIDPIQRKPEGVLQTIQSKLPFISQGVAPMTGYTGEPVKRQAPLINAFSPFKIGVSNPEEDLNYKLIQADKYSNKINTVEKAIKNGTIPQDQGQQQLNLLQTQQNKLLQGTGIAPEAISSTLKLNMPKAGATTTATTKIPKLLKLKTTKFKSKKLKKPKKAKMLKKSKLLNFMI